MIYRKQSSRGVQLEACNFIKKESLAQMLSCEFWEFSKKHLFLQNTSGGCFWIYWKYYHSPECFIVNFIHTCGGKYKYVLKLLLKVTVNSHSAKLRPEDVPKRSPMDIPGDIPYRVLKTSCVDVFRTSKYDVLRPPQCNVLRRYPYCPVCIAERRSLPTFSGRLMQTLWRRPYMV